MQLKMFTRKDIILISILVAFIILFLTFFGLFSDDSCHIATIEQDGQVLYKIDLDKVNDPYELYIDGNYPLTVLVESGNISVEYASCPDQVCVHTGRITNSGQSIICVPDKVSISINGNNSTDAVTG